MESSLRLLPLAYLAVVKVVYLDPAAHEVQLGIHGVNVSVSIAY
jgi:hypothetical protein